MRLLQVTVPTGKRETVLSALEDAGLDYVVTDETGSREYGAVVTVPLPTAAVEPVLEDLRSAGIERDAYTVVLSAETILSKRFDALEQRYREEADEDRIAREELRSRADDLSPGRATFLGLTVVSVVVATAGLLLDSPSVVVGSMVIAPLIGPAMATSVGTVVDDRDLFLQGIRQQVVGFGVAVLAATLFAVVVRVVGLVPPGLDPLAIGEVAERVAPDFLSLAVALGAGAAGAYSLRSDVSASLVGVMIAVALVPPVAAVGIGIAWALPTVVAGAGVLALVNALSINLAAMVVFWAAGYRPESLFGADQARSATLQRVAALGLAVLVLSTALGGVTVATRDRAVVESDVTDAVHGAVEEGTPAGLRVTDVRVTFAAPTVDRPLTPDVRRVVVTVTRPPGTDLSGVADRVATAVRGADPVGGAAVELRVVAVRRADSS